MYQVKCIEKIQARNKHVEGYILIDKNKNEMTVEPDELKEAIRSGRIEVSNLTLTSDNRLMVKRQATSSKSKTIDIERLLNRLKTLGYIINTFNAACGHKCYIAGSMDHLKHMFIIPDDVEYIYKLSDDQDICNTKPYEYISNIEGVLRAIGGENLISTQDMFFGCKAHSIDLTSFNTRNVTDMSYMFYDCKAQSINLSSFDTSNVTNMEWMFGGCEAHSLDLSSFNTSNVTAMHSMFYDCKAQSIDLSSFDTSNVINMSDMFYGCMARSLDLTSFDTSNVTTMNRMFYCCRAQSINLSSFNTSNVTDMKSIFAGCQAQSLDLRSFDTSKVTNKGSMFG